MSPVSWSASYLLREPFGISTTTSISMLRSVASAASRSVVSVGFGPEWHASNTLLVQRAEQGAGSRRCSGGYSHIVRVVAGALLVVLIGAALLVGLRPVTPARTFDDYE